MKEDLEMLKLPRDFEKLKALKKNPFKDLVKSKINILTLNYLINIKDGHSKMTNLKYSNLEIQSYLISENIYPHLAKQIFKWRTRMVNFKMNFKNGSTDLLCPFGCQEEDRQDLILKCPVMISHLPELTSTKIDYNNLFSTNLKE